MKIVTAILWLVPYLASGFSAPFIFKHASSPQLGGHIAGALFIFAGIWSLILSWKFQMPIGVRYVLFFVLSLQTIFWVWRFFDSLPLKDSVFIGLSGSAWHGLLTSLYLLVAIVLLTFEVRSS